MKHLKYILPIGYYSIRFHPELENLVHDYNNLPISDAGMKEGYEYIFEDKDRDEHHEKYFRNIQYIPHLSEYDKSRDSIGHYVRLSNHPDMDPNKYDESEVEAIKKYTMDSLPLNKGIIKIMSGKAHAWKASENDQYDKLISAANKTRAPENMTLFTGVRSANPYIHHQVRHPFISTSFETSYPSSFAGGYGGATGNTESMKKFPHAFVYYDERTAHYEHHIVHPRHVHQIIDSGSPGNLIREIAEQEYHYHPSKGSLRFEPVKTILALHVPKHTPLINTTKALTNGDPHTFGSDFSPRGHATIHPYEREVILPPGGHSVIDDSKSILITPNGFAVVPVKFHHSGV